ncbi:hypothetical protein, partial [Pseudomonas aeruginosa]|uniref:hypothetical protein n=1 Tax=Pseudomonas aeruginosa TaxID=287 RepID=UPI0039C23E25
MAYVFIERGEVYYLPLAKLKEVIAEFGDRWEPYKKTVLNRDTFRKDIRDPQDPRYYRRSVGYAIPI